MRLENVGHELTELRLDHTPMSAPQMKSRPFDERLVIRAAMPGSPWRTKFAKCEIAGKHWHHVQGTQWQGIDQSIGWAWHDAAEQSDVARSHLT